MNAVTFDATFYLQQNPDVFQAIASGRFQGTAEDHFNQFGANEGRDPNAFFDTSYYLQQNPDVLVAVANGTFDNAFDHFQQFGRTEGEVRAPRAEFTAFNATTYLQANPDLQTAFASLSGAALENRLFQHFVEFGVAENRPGSGVDLGGIDNNPGQSINFTATIGETLTGTANNDVFTGVIGATGPDSTINVGDTVNGGAGRDTLNVIVDGGAALPAGFASTSVEVVNINYAGATNLGALNSARFGGVEQLWQIDTDAVAAGTFQNVTVGTGVTAGFRSTGAAATDVAVANTVTAAAGTTAVSVALDGVATSSAITFGETTANGLSTVSVSGSVVTDAGANTLTLTATAADVDNLNLSLTSNTTLTLSGFDDLNTVDATGSSGNLTVDLGTPDELTSARFGAGNDTVTINTGSLAAGTLTLDLGAGNDVLTLDAAGNTALTTVSITLGAGNDTLDINTLTNITDQSNFAADLITVTDFSTAADVLNTAGLGTRDVLTNTELANIANAATLEAALDVAASITDGVGVYSIFNYGGDAYIFRSAAAASDTLSNGDGVIRLAGVDVNDFTATSLVTA